MCQAPCVMHCVELTLSSCDDPRHFICPFTMMVMRVHRASHSSMLKTHRHTLHARAEYAWRPNVSRFRFSCLGLCAN